MVVAGERHLQGEFTVVARCTAAELPAYTLSPVGLFERPSFFS